jgi:hypothetical protein
MSASCRMGYLVSMNLTVLWSIQGSASGPAVVARRLGEDM